MAGAPTIEAPTTGLGPADLAGLLAAFNEVTGRLQATHETLRGEVAGLQRELRQANEQLARSKRLAALGEMAAGIAHEVRNPLSSIRLYARMLEQDLTDRPGERGTAIKIAEAVRGLDAVVGDVLVFARELRVRATRVEASELFSRALDACRGEAQDNVRVDRRDVAKEVELNADPALAQQALVNVIRNAMQAMAEAGGVHVLTLDAEAPVRTARGAGHAVLRVVDTGPGVSQELTDRMFNPFFTTRATGTGLGLAIVHRIVDAHGGRVTAGNRGDGRRGAVFELHIPDAQDAGSELVQEA